VNRKVLLVDDQPEVVEGFARLLGREFEIRTASSAEVGLEELEREGPFAVVVSDYQMPDMSGVEFLTQVRAGWPATARIMLTGVRELDVAIAALHEGEVFRFLTKPLPHDLLRAALEEGVDRHERASAEARLEDELETLRRSIDGLAPERDGRASGESSSLLGLHRLASRLCTADSLDEIGSAGAAAASALLGGRAAELRIAPPERPDASVREHVGPDFGGETHAEQLTSRDGTLGCLEVDAAGPGRSASDGGRALTARERQICASVAALVSVAVTNQIRRLERDGTQNAVVFAMALLAERRDNETGKHLERVSSYCRLIAETLREQGHYTDVIDDAFVRDLVRSSPLHDIGKVGIPDAILRKPGRLDDDEWAVMQTHAQIGADTLRGIIERTPNPGFLRMALDIAWCHHEKWNGTGYPRGLAGRDIPLAARILALADCYDALTTSRPYKGPWEHGRAAEYVRDHAGTQFEPAIVDAFLDRQDAVNEIRLRLQDD